MTSRAAPRAALALALPAPPEFLDEAGSRVTTRITELVGLLPGLAVGLVVILLALLISRWVSTWTRPYRKLSHNAMVRDTARQAVALAVLLFGVLIALDIMGATSVVAAILGTAGVAGLAIGFAFKDLMENYIAGVLLSLRQPFAPDDLVTVDGESGVVVRLSMRATILMTPDGNHLRLPNARVFKATILNMTRNPRRRFDVAIGVASDTELLEAQQLGLDALRALDGVLADPGPSALIEELGDSSVTIRYYGWVDQREHTFGKVKSEAIRTLKITLEGAGIELPEPLYRIAMHGAETPTASEYLRPEESMRQSQAAYEPQSTEREHDDLETAVAEERSAQTENLLSDAAAKE